MWNLPRPGIEPVSPALAGGFLTIVLPGKPYPRPVWEGCWGSMVSVRSCVVPPSMEQLQPRIYMAVPGRAEIGGWNWGGPMVVLVCHYWGSLGVVSKQLPSCPPLSLALTETWIQVEFIQIDYSHSANIYWVLFICARLNGLELGKTPGDGKGQVRLVCCSLWGGNELGVTEGLNSNNEGCANDGAMDKIAKSLPSLS